MTRLDQIENVLRSFHAKADTFEKKLQTIQSWPPLPTASSPDSGKAKSREAEPMEGEHENEEGEG